MTVSTTDPTRLDFNQIQREFQRIWGYDQFRSPQGEIIQALLNQRDALIVMPTGGGKSVCFQLPALLQQGVTIVVSPLIALMENQVQELQQRRLPAALLHSEQPTFHKRQVLQSLRHRQIRLLYLSPETLLSQPVWLTLCDPRIQINGLIIDEAHCLVQWGETFRPAYERLGAVRPAWLRSRPAGTRLPIAAFTATASTAEQAYIAQVLGLEQPYPVKLSPYRSHLRLHSHTVWTPRQRLQRLQQFLRRQRGSGLVYVRSRSTSTELAFRLQQQGYRVAAYHAGLPTDRRRQIEADWLSDRLQFVVCTSAFGMGVNKANVRWIVHYHAPNLLAEYVQEIGRAGRDGQSAIALTLVSEPTGWLDPDDHQRQKFFAQQSQAQQEKAEQLARQLPPTGDIRELTRTHREAAAALGWLHRQGQLEWVDPFTYHLGDRPAAPRLPASEHLMRQFLFTKQCRWQFILQAFGFASEAQELEHCGCDRCRRR